MAPRVLDCNQSQLRTDPPNSPRLLRDGSLRKVVPSGGLYKKMNFENLDLLAGNEVPNAGSKVRVSWERTGGGAPPVLSGSFGKRVILVTSQYSGTYPEVLDGARSM